MEVQIRKFVPTSNAFPFKKFTVTNDWEEKKRTVVTTEIHGSGKKEITTTIHDFSKEEEQTAITTEFLDPEEERRKHQARLAHQLRRELSRRFLNEGRSSADSSDRKATIADAPTPLFGMSASVEQLELQMSENQRVITTSKVKLIYPRVGLVYLGTLEAHINGFTFLGLCFPIVIDNANVEGCFWSMFAWQCNILQFHLKHAIKVGAQETNDIQFCFEDSEKLDSFVSLVKHTQWTYRGDVPITSLHFENLDKFILRGLGRTGRRGIEVCFALTYSFLLGLDGEPFVQPFDVVPLDDIEIVNLALIEAKHMYMAVVFKDFKRDVVELRLPSTFIDGIKERLNLADVKYYVNRKHLDWNDTMRKISESPETFIRDGGWDSLHLEDDRTLAYYPDADSDSEKFDTSLC